MLVWLCTLTTFAAHAQTSKTSQSSDTYGVGTNTISAGIGLGSSIGSGYTYGSQTPGLSLHYDRGIWEAGPGVISLGAYVGYKAFKYNYSDNFGDNATEKWNYTIIGVRGAWHFTGLNVDNLDLYAGVMLSYNDLSFSYSDNQGGAYSGSNYGSAVGFTGFVGAKYFFAGDLGAFAEIGYGVSILNIGLSYKF